MKNRSFLAVGALKMSFFNIITYFFNKIKLALVFAVYCWSHICGNSPYDAASRQAVPQVAKLELVSGNGVGRVSD